MARTSALTHYLPQGSTYALCGTPTSERDHAAAPTCSECVRLLAEQEADDEETAGKIEDEFQEFAGKLRTRDSHHEHR